MRPLILNVGEAGSERARRSSVLREAGYEVVEATGAEAGGLCRERRPALVVLAASPNDLPAAELRRRLDGHSIPILQLIPSPGSEAGASLPAGADGLLVEPVQAAELTAYVGVLLRLPWRRPDADAGEDEEAARLAAALDVARLGAWEYDLAARRSHFDARCREIFDLDRDGPFADEEVFERIHPEDRGAVRGDMQRALEVTGRYESEYRLALAGGRTRWVAVRGYRISAEDPGRARFVGTLMEITGQRQAEEGLRRREREARALAQQIESLYDAAPIGLCVIDAEARFRRINRRLAEINGVAPEAHLGRTVSEVVPGLADAAHALLRRVFETGEPVMGVEVAGEVPSRPGVSRTWIENWHPVRDENGRVVAVSIAAEEITERKRVEEELRHANRLKDEFLATLSHELRTPLTAILGWASLLERGLPADQGRRAVEAIARNAEAQRALLSDILDVSRIVSGRLRLQLEEVDLLGLARRVAEGMEPAVAGKRLRLEVSPAGEETTVTGDPERLQQVIWNLFSNAVKFTPPGGRIDVGVHRHGGMICLRVSDTGVGIPVEFLPSVFDRFSQADGTTSRRHGGLGLGLAIVRHLVELHGGRVSASSDGPGRGATFTVALPLRAVRGAEAAGGPALEARQETAAAGDRGERPLDGLRVLVLDDLEDARALVAAVVETAGGAAVPAASAEEALAAIEAEGTDLVLADIGMPGIDGYEFVRRLRADDARSGGPRAIALTAYGSATDRARALSAGFDEHLAKPVLFDELVAAITRVLGRPAR